MPHRQSIGLYLL